MTFNFCVKVKWHNVSSIAMFSQKEATRQTFQLLSKQEMANYFLTQKIF